MHDEFVGEYTILDILVNRPQDEVVFEGLPLLMTGLLQMHVRGFPTLRQYLLLVVIIFAIVVCNQILAVNFIIFLQSFLFCCHLLFRHIRHLRLISSLRAL